MKDAQAFGLRQIQRDAALVAIAGEIVCAQVPGKRRAPASRLVAGPGPFHLDNVRAQIAEDLAAERPGQHARGVEDSDSMEQRMRIGCHRP